ncbi:MAG: hypothetical protein Q8O41_07570, partial [Candidatus Methanoperedens sp.]|nr:hypothetical protein [Candidatus Methanoperedens sp.]
MVYRYYMLGIMKVSHILIYLVLISLFSVPASADLIIESASVINTGDKGAWGPAWSPDVNSIAYIAYYESNNQQIFTINIDGTGKKQVTNDTIKKWSIERLDDEISFLSFDTDGLEKIFLVHPDGSGRRKLLDEKTRQGRAPEDKPPALGGASWNPDTKQILFTSFDDKANEKIYLVNIDGTGKKQLITDEFRQWNPQWSPGGNSFVYVSYDDKYHEQLFTANANGTGKKQITSDELKKSDPNWGQDGILYVSYETASSIGEKIFIINPDGTGKKLLIKDGFKQRNPRWSRDGTRIIYEDITTQGNLTFKVLNLQKPAATITPMVTITPEATPTPIPTPAATASPAVTITPSPTVTETPKVEESPTASALKEVLYSMLLVLVIIVAV